MLCVMFQSHIDIKNIKEKLRITIQAPEQELNPRPSSYYSCKLWAVLSLRAGAGDFPCLSVMLLPLRPVSLTHKNPQRRKIIHGMHPVKCKDRLKGNFPLAEGIGFCCGGRLGMATNGV